ncbi:HalD/BesD family halogenase [Ruegeria hyattellae]|uniref:HalD/BesD family halogenase n=1 Tax=Ruegeria hyattellae TaxID=3233337 RepID=UPI00355BDD50
MTDTRQLQHEPALDLIDLDRYPIADLDSGDGAEFLTECQRHMEENGWCNLAGFVRTEALEQLNGEANDLLPTAEVLHVKRNIYQGAIDPSLPEDDPRRKEFTHTAVQLADDQIPAATRLKQLYHSEILTDFVRRVQKKDQLYHCADEFQALNVVALHPESWHAWHYDTTECTVTLLLQAAETGGDFTFLPNSRNDDGEDREAVDRLLAGDMSHAQTFSRGAGAFTLFRGGYSLHGVTKVEGSQSRISAIMTYDEKPNRVIEDEINIRIYGKRVENILANRKAAANA